MNIDFYRVGNRPIIVKTVRGIPASLLGYCSVSGAFEALPHLMNDVNSLDSLKLDKSEFFNMCEGLAIKVPEIAI